MAPRFFRGAPKLSNAKHRVPPVSARVRPCIRCGLPSGVLITVTVTAHLRAPSLMMDKTKP
eukprot:2773229-Prymnesium_polylepis.1